MRKYKDNEVQLLLDKAGKNLPLRKQHILTLFLWGIFKSYKLWGFIDALDNGMSWEHAYRTAKVLKTRVCYHTQNHRSHKYLATDGTPMIDFECYDCGYKDHGHVYSDGEDWVELKIVKNGQIIFHRNQDQQELHDWLEDNPR